MYAIKPAPAEIFRAFQLTPFESVRVVIIGQDPYPFQQHADGLAFSSKMEETPASLRYILREVDRDVIKTQSAGEYEAAFRTNDLSSWAKQGVFLINSSLTVRAGVPGSHSEIGWQQFTSAVLRLLWVDPNPKVFVIWGGEARSLFSQAVSGFDNTYHLMLDTGHPASGAHGQDKFSGCNHFSKINYYFYRKQLPVIDWKLNAV